jgi:hypothetical protein
MLRSMRRHPNPRRIGGLTGGPPRSHQSILSQLLPSFVVIAQVIEIRPKGADNAPYFREFVVLAAGASSFPDRRPVIWPQFEQGIHADAFTMKNSIPAK